MQHIKRIKAFLFVSVFLIIYCSCQSNHSQTKEIAGLRVRSQFFNDSIFDGQTFFYNRKDELEEIANYKLGVRDGPSIYFHSNGKVYDSVNYTNGLKNGYRYVFDSLGELRHVEYYYMGRKLGPDTYIDRGKVTDFNFSSFEREGLYSVSIDSVGNKINSYGSIGNAVPYQRYVDDELFNFLFAYFIFPPKMSVSYELVSWDANRKETSLISFNNEVFTDTIVSKGITDAKYFLKANVFDSIEQKATVHYSQLIYSRQKE